MSSKYGSLNELELISERVGLAWNFTYFLWNNLGAKGKKIVDK